MIFNNGGIGKIVIRSGTAFSRGITIDPLLDDADAAALYEKWDNTWAEPLECGGGVKAITCEMVAEAPEEQLVKRYGRPRAERLLSVARANLTQ